MTYLWQQFTPAEYVTAMSLYHEAAQILDTARKNGGSLKSLVFGKKTWKNDAKTLYALTTEAAKWSEVLADVVEKSSVLSVEKSLSPTLALLLTHDLFLARKGIALPATHGLNTSIARHKVRLSAELTKARLRRGCASIDALRAQIESQAANAVDLSANDFRSSRHPRWIRINAIKTTLDQELETSFSAYKTVDSLSCVTDPANAGRLLYIDENVPNLIAIAGPDNPTNLPSYKNGNLIIQEKASCFPAYLLDPSPGAGDVVDACAAPGNKTTHTAAILAGSDSRVFACEKNPARSQTLYKMVKLAGGEKLITIKQKQDFLKLEPSSKELSNVTSLLLDPSCSGSGIFGRDEISLTVHLPSTTASQQESKGKKRKRGSQKTGSEDALQANEAIVEETPEQTTDDESKLKARLENLASFQLRILLHAMTFPAARRITYSTCSIHALENESVVVKALLSDIAAEGGWTILSRSDQVDGMRRWHKRGSPEAVQLSMAASPSSAAANSTVDAHKVADACIRCDKGGEDGTMGFFVAAFTRTSTSFWARPEAQNHDRPLGNDQHSEEEWTGFSDNDA